MQTIATTDPTAGIDLLGSDDRATIALAHQLRVEIERGDLPAPQINVTANHSGRLSIEVEAVLFAEDLWCASVRYRWSRSGSLEVLIDDSYDDSLPDPGDDDDVSDFVRSTARQLSRDYHACRRRYCTGSLDQDDLLRHYDADGACPIHPDAEMLA